ncbi:MAG: GMC family oxidoreductase, partial [Deltaproteobacteria bacterium]|nr:GMC family oxidoreductase [Deltaproteobacteria bacterium]
MSFEQTWDVVIIGTGAGGGTLAHALASTGKRILLLERGDFLPREAQNWSTKSVVGEGRYKTKEVWLDKDGHDVHPHTHYWVGGNTKVYGAVLARMRERDFGEVEHFDGTSPAWPVSYADFEPHYTAAERLYQVHGERGADPTEPPASAPYPHPPVSHEPPIQQLFDAMKAAGHKPFALPVGIQLDEQAPQKSQCVRCGTCDGFPCLVKGKSDAHVICVEPALLHDNVQLITGAKVLKLDTDPSGKTVTDVIFEKGGARRTVRGRIVVVSAGAINSAALLLKSANDQHPKGLANGS